MFKRIVICGVGLIGGSFALALRKAGLVEQLVGMGRTRAPLEAALALGVIDVIATDWESALADADLVLLGMPVGQMLPVMQAMQPYLAPGTIVTDAGSTKCGVVLAARMAFGERIAQFVPAHPIAGAEKSGVEAARVDLYAGKRVVLTRLSENAANSVAVVRAAWQACGAAVSELSAEEHDQIFAAVSHLPHLLAFSLVHEFLMRPNADQLFGFAASGFRDFTRIASSHPEMWRDICLDNRQSLIAELDAYLAELMRARVLLAKADGPGLEAMFSLARERRDAWLAAQRY
ncbi:MAG: prephenate dehydrogenase/arogenate dehydrogenase family protein [Rhodocyclaceae bacterium]|jgi:prephenate dehydrogenase|nr:prephenate dehydrogenase/arogenate dehydrogenase family protein [Rhodocyclaceae bacterium]MBK6907115.1 prephenate dehydrogenase/arogenate dehydrogenase family protein [Rhodocyclaceae bacterium]